MAITRNFNEFTKTWLSIGDREDDVFVGDGKVEGGPSDGEWHTKDEMRGGGGDDYFDGEFGINIMFGERGADTFEIGNSGPGGSWDRAYGGDGWDIFLAFEYSPMEGKVHLANGGYGFDTLKVLSYLTTGEDGPAVLRNEKIILNGQAILKLKSVEEVIGNVEDDSLRASGAVTHLEGGSGDDFLSANPGESSSLIGGEGSDILKGGRKGDALYDQENIDFATPDRMDPGNDELIGGKGNDYLLSYAGNDKLFGGDGKDEIVSLNGTDIIRGGGGDDKILFGIPFFSDDPYREGEARILGTLDGIFIDGGSEGKWGDLVDFSFTGVGFGASTEKGLVIDLARGRGKEYTSLDDPGRFRIKDIENVYGSGLNDKLTGSGEDNILRGMSGDDILKGKQGNDTLVGGDGRDQLFGGGGDDVLLGDSDGDILSGGADGDSFIIRGNQKGTVIITDFEIATDSITIRGEGFDAISRTDGDAGAVLSTAESTLTIVLEGVLAADLIASDFLFS